MTEKEKVSKLSKLLEDAADQVRRCDELNPWGGIETQGAFLEACSAGALMMAGLYQIDRDIIGRSRRLKALSQLDLDHLLKLKPDTDKQGLKQRSRTWGRMLEATGDLTDAAKFCARLAEEEKRWSKGQDYRIKFKECSEKLAGCLLYDLLDVLAEYDPEEHASLRLQVLCSYLKELRVEFLWDACARGPCRSDTIPDQCKFENLSHDLKGQLVIVHGEDQHKLTFGAAASGESECLINNTGIKNYRALLNDIWDVTTGKLHSYPQDGSAVWAVKEHQRVQNLEAYASIILKLLRPLSALAKHGECAGAIKAIVTKGRRRWSKWTHIQWSYLNDLDKLIAELDGQPKPYELEP
jgi:hypothetical protein